MPEYVYFVEGAGQVKIGWAKDPKKRLANLQIGSHVKLFLIGLIETENALALEVNLHKQFCQYRIYGEWFEFCHPIRAYIQSQTCTTFLTSARVSRDLTEKSVLSALTRDWQGKTALSAATGRRAYINNMAHYVIGVEGIDPNIPVTIVFNWAEDTVIVTQNGKVFTVHISTIEKR